MRRREQQERNREIADLIRIQGIDYEEVAKLYNVSPFHALKVAQMTYGGKYTRNMNKQRWIREEALQMLKDGVDGWKILVETGVSKRHLYLLAEQNGLTIKNATLLKRDRKVLVARLLDALKRDDLETPEQILEYAKIKRKMLPYLEKDLRKALAKDELSSMRWEEGKWWDELEGEREGRSSREKADASYV